MSLKLINSALQSIIEKSTVFGALTILIDKNGEAVITGYTQPHLSDMEKMVSQATINAAAAHLVAQSNANMVQFVRGMQSQARGGIAINGTVKQ